MLQLPSLWFRQAPAEPPAARKFDFVFLGKPTPRREAALAAARAAGAEPAPIGQYTRQEMLAMSRVCIGLHSYDGGALELHRLGEHAEAGCLALYEDSCDTLTQRALAEEAGVVVFAPFGGFAAALTQLLRCIHDEPEWARAEQLRAYAWWHRELEDSGDILRVLFDS
eukprot:TRINITY_DN2062_c0_g1_i5.p1 TRINITY_DN2062_c0_g1~~TRINITY_DN2062_c0_g1_i5.p1  ORF type:complete len:168 (-),score=54.64 TRINITY_DN2062_c0_g1_i5:76-579(-)